MSLTYKRELITPQRARQLLDSMPENQRNPKTGKIPGYARDIETNRWDSNTGETLKIDVEGQMIDGQNRCLAVIMANTPTYFDVVYDVPTTAMPVLDTGASRTAADALKILSVQDRTRATGIVRWTIMWDAGVKLGQGGKFSPTSLEIVHRYEAEQGLYNAATSRATDCQNHKLATGAPAGVAYYLFRKLDPVAADDFFDKYISGANLSINSPILTLAKRMRQIKIDRTTRPEQLALFVRAWNAYCRDETPSQFIISKTGKLTSDNFPIPLKPKGD